MTTEVREAAARDGSRFLGRLYAAAVARRRQVGPPVLIELRSGAVHLREAGGAAVVIALIVDERPRLRLQSFAPRGLWHQVQFAFELTDVGRLLAGGLEPSSVAERAIAELLAAAALSRHHHHAQGGPSR